MGEFNQCDLCGQPATIHLTQIVDGEIRKTNLCESCQAKAGAELAGPLGDLAEAAAGAAGATEAGEEEEADFGIGPCPSCGCDVDALRRTGRFGCADCYDHFQPALPGILARLQPGFVHAGKEPAAQLARREREEHGEHLRKELARAIREERYEDAAAFRDLLQGGEQEETRDGARS